MTIYSRGPHTGGTVLGPVKRAIRRAFHAAGYAVVPLPERIRERSRPDGAAVKPVGLHASMICARGAAEQALENILRSNSTGLDYDLGDGLHGEVKFVSAITLHEVLMPFDRVDLLEADTQHAEIDVFPPFIDLLDKKVRRVHIGTHGREAHELLRTLLSGAGWELVFDYAPDSSHMTEQGRLELIDGILSARNPALGAQRA